MGKRGRKNYGNKGGNFAKKSRQGGNRDNGNDSTADAAANGDWDASKAREDGFTEWVYTNDNFIKYYKAQNIVPEAEWESFMKFLATPLPTTFRINNSCSFAERIRERIATDFQFDGLVVDDEAVAPIAPIAWYPNAKGFQWSVERRKVRKLPLLAEFQKWLVELTTTGATTRQEAVSMIPPLVLDVAPHHRVLDMCAAPGSKTSQLLESLHALEFVTGATPTGMVMANDVDLKRAYMLVHQSKRIGSPALLVTCHEAQHIPFVGASGKEAHGCFDRILCDAPCSGDGTLRKNPSIWKNWDAKNGIALHPLQVEIAKRGASLLAIGGFMCYSTCTFNPLENEAVVAELLRWSNGALELVDVSDRLPLLKRRPGIRAWKVFGSDHTEFKSFGDFVDKADAVTRGKNKITPTMFPPSEDEATAFHLERCMRCVPHDENTGGFFICLLKKTKATPVLAEQPAKRPASGRANRVHKQLAYAAAHAAANDGDVAAVDDKTDVQVEVTEEAAEAVDDVKDDEAAVMDAAAVDAVAMDVEGEAATATDTAVADNKPVDARGPRLNRQERRALQNRGNEYVALDATQWQRIQSHFGIQDDDATALSGAQLLTRSDESKSVTLVTKSITHELIETMKAKKLKVVYTGLKLFERTEQSGSVNYRLCQAGLPHVLPSLTKRTLSVTRRDFQMLLERLGDLIDFDEFDDPVTQQAFADASIGSIVCSMANPQSLVEEKIMNIVVWRGRNSVNPMATKADAVVILSAMKELKLYDEQVRVDVLAAKQQRDAARTKRDEPADAAAVTVTADATK